MRNRLASCSEVLHLHCLQLACPAPAVLHSVQVISTRLHTSGLHQQRKHRPFDKLGVGWHPPRCLRQFCERQLVVVVIALAQTWATLLAVAMAVSSGALSAPHRDPTVSSLHSQHCEPHHDGSLNCALQAVYGSAAGPVQMLLAKCSASPHTQTNLSVHTCVTLTGNADWPMSSMGSAAVRCLPPSPQLHCMLQYPAQSSTDWALLLDSGRQYMA